MTCLCEHTLDSALDETPEWDALVAARYGAEPGTLTCDVLQTIKNTTLGDVTLDPPAWYPADAPKTLPVAPSSDYDSDQSKNQEPGVVDDSCSAG